MEYYCCTLVHPVGPCDSGKASVLDRLPGIQRQAMSCVTWFTLEKALLRTFVDFHEQTFSFFFLKKKRKEFIQFAGQFSLPIGWPHSHPLGYYKLSKFLPPQHKTFSCSLHKLSLFRITEETHKLLLQNDIYSLLSLSHSLYFLPPTIPSVHFPKIPIQKKK